MAFITSFILCAIATVALADWEYSCPKGWEVFQGKCYNIPFSGWWDRGETLISSEANDKCKELGGSTAYIENEAIQEFVSDLMRRTAPDYVKSVWVLWKHYLRPDWSDYMGCSILTKDSGWKWSREHCGKQVGSNDRAYVCELAAGMKECHGDSCYELQAQANDKDVPAERCEKRGGYPVEINSQEEQTFVENFINRAVSKYYIKYGVWIGANDKDSEGNFVWQHGGTSVDDGFSNWARGQPDDKGAQDCAELSRSKGWKWMDIRCSYYESFQVLCESPNVSGITG